jgi:hypothetical protein
VEKSLSKVRTIKEESHLETRFKNIWALVAADLPIIHQKKHVIPGRRFVYDFEIIGKNVLVECQGGIFSRGNSGHSSGVGIQNDAEKVNRAQLNGYHIFQLTPEKLTVSYLTEIAEFCRSYDNPETVISTILSLEELG